MYAESNDDGDQRLLRRAAEGSAEALAEVARRYVGFVYAAALRQVRDPHLAEDVTQAVFVILAQKVRRIKPGTLPHAWLFTTTRYAAANALKLRARRTHHERKAAAMREQERQSSDASTDQITPLLDEALAHLRESDRSAVLLSYLAGKSWREVAAALGTTEEAARKRVSRAVGQLRGFFARRGIATSGAALVAVLTASAEASVPPALLGGVTAAVTIGTISAAAGTGGAATASMIAKGAMHMMTWAHVKVAAAVALAVFAGALGVAGAGAMVLRQAGKPAPASLEASADKPGAVAATLDNGVTVELVAVSRRDDDDPKWWNADGSPSDQKFNDTDSRDDPPHSHQIVIRVTGADDCGLEYSVPNSRGWSSNNAMQGNTELEGFKIVSFFSEGAPDSTRIRVNIAAGDWETLVSTFGVNSMMAGGEDKGNAAISPLIDANGQTAVTVSDMLENHERRLVAVDKNGNEHLAMDRMSVSGGKVHLNSVKFPLQVDDVAQVRFMARPFDQFVEFQDVSLVAGKKTEPKVEKGN